MTEANAALRAVIVERYHYLLAHLERRLRSRDLAAEALHDTYANLSEREKELPAVQNPVGFLLRAATNLALDRLRAQKRLVTVAEVETAFNLVDDAPTPAQTAETNSEFQLFVRAVAELPHRRRAILLMFLKDRLSAPVIAQRVGMSRRRVDIELRLAQQHCARVIEKSRKK
jgi:RNA polymerase sigma factor (sigma-70 family)